MGTLKVLADGRLAGSTGCNRFSGPYAQSGEDLTITTELISAAACIGPAGEQDPAVIAALDKVAGAGVAADQLVLKDGQGAQPLVYAPGLAGLQGTSWTATGINNGNQAVSWSATVTTITVEFGRDNALSGFGGCNNYTSTWTTTEPDGLTTGAIGDVALAGLGGSTRPGQTLARGVGELRSHVGGSVEPRRVVRPDRVSSLRAERRFVCLVPEPCPGDRRQDDQPDDDRPGRDDRLPGPEQVQCPKDGRGRNESGDKAHDGGADEISNPVVRGVRVVGHAVLRVQCVRKADAQKDSHQTDQDQQHGSRNPQNSSHDRLHSGRRQT